MSKLPKYGASAAALAGAGIAAYKAATNWEEKGRKEIENADLYELRPKELEIMDYFQRIEQKTGRDDLGFDKIKEILEDPKEYFYNKGRKEALKDRSQELHNFYSKLDDTTEESGQ